MSTNLEEARHMMCCAACGIAGADDIKLKKCTACKSVRYCGVKCQKEHRPKHKRECKRRAAELRDEILFKQPESHLHGDCPICCILLELDDRKSFMMTCCGKTICGGCAYANQMRKAKHLCPFCRQPAADTDEEVKQLLMRRVEANDPAATYQAGVICSKEGDYKGAAAYFTKAVGLGDISAHYELSGMYNEGVGVERDEKKHLHHLEQAAIGGHPLARHNLGYVEWKSGRTERTVKHFIIAAKLGLDESLESLKKCYGMGFISKEDFAAALRGHQATVDAMKSPHRDKAKAALRVKG
eukprot:scaffold8372_cov88-Skeletonema_dohrnii-CCMP3373.AAC.5